MQLNDAHPYSRGVPLSINTSFSNQLSPKARGKLRASYVQIDEGLEPALDIFDIPAQSQRTYATDNVEKQLQSRFDTDTDEEQDRDEKATVDFYAEHARSIWHPEYNFDQDELNNADVESPVNFQDVNLSDGDDDIGNNIETPLLPQSPAIPSSNTSILLSSTRGPRHSNSPRSVRSNNRTASKVLRSIRSRSSRASAYSARRSSGNRSTRSSSKQHSTDVASVRTPSSGTGAHSWNATWGGSTVQSDSPLSRRSFGAGINNAGVRGWMMPSPLPASQGTATSAAGISGQAVDSANEPYDIGVSRLSTSSRTDPGSESLPGPSTGVNTWTVDDANTITKKKGLGRILRRSHKPAYGPRQRSNGGSISSVSSVQSPGGESDNAKILPPIFLRELSVVEESSSSINEAVASHGHEASSSS